MLLLSTTSIVHLNNGEMSKQVFTHQNISSIVTDMHIKVLNYRKVDEMYLSVGGMILLKLGVIGVYGQMSSGQKTFWNHAALY